MHLDRTNRREFITLFGGTAATWPLAAQAQQLAMPVVGFLHLTSPETNRENLATFRLGLADTGYVEGKNVAIEYRWAHDRNDRLAILAAELVGLQVSVIVVLVINLKTAKALRLDVPLGLSAGANEVIE